jgi:excisionase family DNA binding protein
MLTTTLPAPQNTPKAPPAAPDYLTPLAAAAYTTLSIETVRIWIREKRVKAHKVGRRWLIERTSIDKLVRGEA